jgi:hypothetical protein
MPSQKPSVLNRDRENPVNGDTSILSQGMELFTRPEKMVELLLKTQPYHCDQDIRLSENRLAEELAWLVSWDDDGKSESEHLRRALRLAYHAGYLLKNHDEQSNQQYEKLLDALRGLCNCFAPTTSLQRVVVLCEIPLLALGLQVGSQCHFADRQAIYDRLSSICNDDFDGEGMLASSDLCDFAEVLASLARIIQIVRSVTAVPPLPEAVLNQFQWAVRQLLVICSGNGVPFGGKDIPLSGELVALLLKLGGDPSDVRLAQHLGLLSEPGHEFTASLVAKTKRPKSSFHSEWAQVAILRSGWGRKRRELAISFCGTQVEVALQSCGSGVLQGRIGFTLEVDGVCVKPIGTWMETCWQSDDDADYLELELEMDSGWRIQRQFCVSRHSGAVMIADVVLGNTVSDVRHTLKMAASLSGARFSVTGDGRELLVETENLRGLVLPVGLSEWRTDRRPGMRGELTAADGLKLVSCGEQVAALYCPLFFALTPRAADKQFTWRRLVVANKLAIEVQDQAAAFRIQVGGRQWLLYRSLTAQANRTFMGQNYAAEFVFGEFLLDGKLKPYVEIS